MIGSANEKPVSVIIAASTATNATATGNIDTLGFEYCSISVVLDSTSSVSNKPAVIKVTESDDTNSSNFANITALVGGGTGGFTIPSMSSTSASIFKFDIDLKSRKRYLKVSHTPLATAHAMAVVAQLSRANVLPISATTLGTAVYASI